MEIEKIEMAVLCYLYYANQIQAGEAVAVEMVAVAGSCSSSSSIN